MRLESYRDGFAAASPSPGHNLMQHVRMSAMHAVKIPHADQRRTKAGRNFIECAKNLHGSIGKNYCQQSRIGKQKSRVVRFQTPASSHHATAEHAWAALRW